LDSSALVKRYVAEPGSAAVRALLRGPARPATSRVAFAEVAAAVARRQREGDLSAAARDRILSRLRRDMDALVVVEVTADLMESLAGLVRTHPLRGFDAIHLASCLAITRGVPASAEFVCTDPGLAEAARACGMRVVTPDR
jgi:predicted nucleic acid-binding protein